MWLQISTSCGHNSNCDCKMLKVAVILRNYMTSTFNMMQSHFELWQQNVEKLQSRDCNFQHFTVIIQNFIVATFNKLQSEFEIWLQLLKSAVTWLQLLTLCSHNSKCAVIHYLLFLSEKFTLLQFFWQNFSKIFSKTHQIAPFFCNDYQIIETSIKIKL